MTRIVNKIMTGDVRTVAKIIRAVDDGIPGVEETLKALYRHTGRAHVIGVTGTAGVGKSTLVDQMIHLLRRDDKAVGVLAVDPTSPFSGGAVLGDRVRMQSHSMDEGVFIHSLATRGYFGGLTRSMRGAIDVLDAMGKDTIIVETVGVGQQEVDIVKSAQTIVVVVVPGMGDHIQAMKAGLLEVADIFVVNKADKGGLEHALGDLRLMIEMGQKNDGPEAWKPPIIVTEALHNKGVRELMAETERHREYLIKSTGSMKNSDWRKKRIREELMEMVKERLVQDALVPLVKSGEIERFVEAVAKGVQDPYSACEKLVSSVLSQKRMK
jgi:LAO/AO transport system kinase